MRSPTDFSLPVVDAPSGFPSPAEDYIDQRLNLNEHLIIRPSSTYFFRVRGDSMSAAGIASGDLLVVDRSVSPKPGHVVVAAVDGNLTVKRLKLAGRKLALATEVLESPLILLTEERSVEIWGVAVYVIHGLTSCRSL
jgi:DNA polymerase V